MSISITTTYPHILNMVFKSLSQAPPSPGRITTKNSEGRSHRSSSLPKHLLSTSKPSPLYLPLSTLSSVSLSHLEISSPFSFKPQHLCIPSAKGKITMLQYITYGMVLQHPTSGPLSLTLAIFPPQRKKRPCLPSPTNFHAPAMELEDVDCCER